MGGAIDDDDVATISMSENQGGHTRTLIATIEELIANSSSHLELSKKLETLL